MGYQFQQRDIDVIIWALDINKDGYINLQEFKMALNI